MAQLRCTNVAFCCSGCTPFSVDGANGRLLEVTDDLSCSIFSANTIAGLPVIEAFANYCVSMGQFGGHKFEVTCTSIRGGKCTTASGVCSVVVGGFCNTASGQQSFVGGGGVNTASNTYSSILGGTGNSASGYGATIAGGSSNIACDYYAFVGGGYLSTASGNRSFVGGGEGNTASSYNAVVVGGGQNSIIGTLPNCATQAHAAIVGGSGNIASGYHSFVGGGQNNTASGYRSVVVGGGGGYINNAATNAYSFLGGGFCNKACGYVSFVGGGQGNTAGNYFVTNGNFQVAVGGYQNTASGNYSFIGGGYSNFIDASSPYNSIVGGLNNSIQGPTPTTGACNTHIVGGCITATSNNYTYVNNLCQTGGGLSDCRVKNTIEPVRFGLQEITQLNPVSFCWNGDSTCHKKYGFIAQNVQQAMSCVVTCNKLHKLGPDGTQVLNGEEGEPLLEFEKDAVYASYVNAFKELKKENDELRTRLDLIESILKSNNLM